MPPRRAASVATAVAGLALAGLVVAVTVASPRLPFPSEPTSPPPTYAPPAPLPPAAAVPASAAISDLPDEAWLIETAQRTDIPIRALAAYAGAAIAKSRAMASCGLSWNTIAAIGFVESKHGTHDGSTVAASGRVSPAIFGPSLSGNGTAHIADSDNGRFDEDKKYDRAIGPMQMIPETWRNWRTDASGDGKRDPQNIDDASMAAANYLCRASPDMVGEAGWRAGIASYNSAPSYLHAVARVATAYGASPR
jgi:hypothetical protein